MPHKLSNNINIDVLRECLSYEPSTGLFRWRQARRGMIVGSIAGSPNREGYIKIGMGKRVWLAHRLAWAHFYGEMPHGIIDHINRNRADNRINNLRIVSQRDNTINAARYDGRSATRGTSRHYRKYTAQIRIAGKKKYLGLFETQEEAREAYERACKGVYAP